MYRGDQPAEHILGPVGIVRHDPAGQRLTRNVDMAIHEARRDHETRSVQRLARREAGADLLIRADAVDPVALNRKSPVAQDPASGIHRHDPGISDEQVDRGGRGHVKLFPGCIGYIHAAQGISRIRCDLISLEEAGRRVLIQPALGFFGAESVPRDHGVWPKCQPCHFSRKTFL